MLSYTEKQLFVEPAYSKADSFVFAVHRGGQHSRRTAASWNNKEQKKSALNSHVCRHILRFPQSEEAALRKNVLLPWLTFTDRPQPEVAKT